MLDGLGEEKLFGGVLGADDEDGDGPVGIRCFGVLLVLVF